MGNWFPTGAFPDENWPFEINCERLCSSKVANRTCGLPQYHGTLGAERRGGGGGAFLSQTLGVTSADESQVKTMENLQMI